jgi:Protein of unknown function (DUF1153)
MRWTPRRKAKIAAALSNGEITQAEAKDLYHLSDEELEAWMRDYTAHGWEGLRVTRLRQYNPRPRPPIADANGDHPPDLPIAGIPPGDF